MPMRDQPVGCVLYVAKVIEVWRLLHRGEVVAELHVTSADFPWLNAQVVRRQGFELIEPLFEDELGHLDLSLDGRGLVPLGGRAVSG